MDMTLIVAWIVVLGAYGLAILVLYAGLKFLGKRHPKLSVFLNFAMFATVLYCSALDGRYILASISFVYALFCGWVLQDKSKVKIQIAVEKEDDKVVKG